MTYTKRAEREDDFETVVEETIDALEDEGFGVLTDVDVQDTMREKLDEDMDQYRILGACDPSTAFAGLQEDPALGALLPCNVAVREREDGTVVVDAIAPTALLGLAENEDLEAAVDGVDERFDRVVESVRA
ncbi:MAG: DUF302 domain-containing protein [Halanaeroarchaeum sp.]